MTDVLLLGGTGMLGYTVKATLEAAGLHVVSTARDGSAALAFDAQTDDAGDCITAAGTPPLIVNAIGIIKPHINESDNASRQQSIDVNSSFPHRLALAAESAGSHVIQIATDCVYSGAAGLYKESAAHDALDVYGKTKSLGEVPSPAMTHLRCSIIGPENGRSTSLWEWLIGQTNDGTVNGYTDHLWNGVTTHAYGRICAGIAKSGWREPGAFHLIPGDIVTKAQLLVDISTSCDRGDITVNAGPAPTAIDRTLATEQPDTSAILWGNAGYDTAPTIAEMVSDAEAFRKTLI